MEPRRRAASHLACGDCADGTAEARGSTEVWFCSDEHTTFAPPKPVGERVMLIPAHVDPTMAYHERAYVFRGDEVVDVWSIDLRGW